MKLGKTKNIILKYKSFFCFILVLFSISISAFSQSVVLKNNLLYDATLTPNIGIEVKLAARWTAGLNLGYQPWPFKDTAERKMRHLLVAPEVRY